MPGSLSHIISGLKQILPDSTWNWVIPALLKEPLVWESLCSIDEKDNDYIYKKIIHRPEDCTPAAVALALLNYPCPPEQLRSLPLLPVDEGFRDAVEGVTNENTSGLPQAGLLALQLREEYRKQGAWDNGLGQFPPAALCCLFGVIPDQLMLLKTIIDAQENKSDTAEIQSIQLALHVLLSNPLPPEAVSELVVLLLPQLPLSCQHRMISILNEYNPQLGSQIARCFLNNYAPEPLEKPTTLLEAIKELNQKAEFAEISRLAGDTERGSFLLEEIKKGYHQFSASLNSEIAKNALIRGESEKAIEALEQAIEYDSSSGEVLSSLLFALIDQNRCNEARQRLNEYGDSHETIEHPGILLANALIEYIAREGNSLDQMMSGREIGLKIIYFLRDASTSNAIVSNDIPFITRLIKFLLSVNLAQEAAWVADHYLANYSQNPSLQHLSAQANYAAANFESAVKSAHLAVAEAPFENKYCRTLAECLEATQDWENAIIERNRIIELSDSPQSIDFHALGKCAIRAGKLDNGKRACQQALSLNPNDGIAYAILGEINAQDDHSSEAADYLNQAIQLNPNNIYPWKALAEFHYKSGNPEKALETIKAATHITPDSPDIFLLLGEAYQKSNSPTMALEAYKQAASIIDNSVLPINPDDELFFESMKKIEGNCRISEKLGAILCDLGHIEESQSVLEKALGIYPFAPNLAYQLSHTYIAQHEYSAALSALQTVLACNPSSAQPYIDYARCALALQKNRMQSMLYSIDEDICSSDQNGKDKVSLTKTDELISSLQKALQIDPTLEEARILLAEVLAIGGDYSIAIDAYRAALETELAKDKSWQSRLDFGLGIVALKLNQGETAVAALLEANKADPSNPLIHQALSEAYQMLGLNEDAFNSARAALMIDANNVDLLAWFAKQVLSLKDYQGETIPHGCSEAVAALRRASALAPQRADLAILLGQIQFEMGDRNGAIDSFNKIIPVQNQEYTLDILPSELYAAGKYLLMLNLPLGACSCLELALEKDKSANTASKPRLAFPNPSPLDIYSLLAKCRRQSGANLSALEAINQAISLAPDKVDLYLEKIDLTLETYPGLLSRKDADEGISTILECLDTAYKIDPENPDIHFRYALILRMIGKLSSAQSHAEKAADLYKSLQPVNSPVNYIDNEPFNGNELSARILAAEIACGRLAYDNAQRILESAYQTDTLPGYPNRKEALIASEGSLPVDYSCLHAELALAADDPSTAANDLANIPQSSLSRARALVLQARLAIRRGDRATANKLFQQALEEIGTIQSSIAPQWTQISSFGDIAAAFDKIALYQAVAETALELHQWESALYLLREAAFVAYHEPQTHLLLARATVMRAEYQNLCQETEVVTHAPGMAALSDASHKAFTEAIQNARQTLDSEGNQVEINTPIQRWNIRGRAIFEGNLEISEAFSQGNAKPDDIAAQIAALRRLDHVSEAGQIGRLHAHHPFVLIQLALTLKNENPRQALAAAYSAHEAAHKSSVNSKPGQPAYQSPYIWAIAPIINYLLANLTFSVGNRNGDYTTALKAIEDAISEWDDEPYWHLLAANILQATKTPDHANAEQDALSHLQKAAELDPQNGSLYISIGNIFLKEKDIRQAIDAFEQACCVLPDNADAWLLLGQCYDTAGNLAEAKRCVDQAISLDPTQPPSLLLRAQIALKNKDYLSAERLANTVLQFEPDNTTAMLLLTRVLTYLDKAGEGLALLDKALSNAQDNPALRLERIRLLHHTNQFNTAISELKELTQRYPNDPAILTVYAEVLEEMGEKFEAIKMAQRALRLGHERDKSQSFDEHIGLHILLGKLLHQTGQLDQAIQHLTEAVQSEPTLLEPYLELAQIYKERRDNGQALNLFQQAMKTAPEDHRPYYLAGLLLKETKDYLGAEKMLRKAAKLAPNELPIQRQLGALVALNLVHNRSTAHPL